MLRMLGGTKIEEENGDGIEKIFQGTEKSNFKSYWEKLIKENVVVFYYLPLNNFGLSDDLYIKMNARGKQLSSFENFKADLIGYIKEQTEGKSLDKSEQAKWEDLLDQNDGIPVKLDTAWTDIFWENKSPDDRIDEIYFAFINRFFLNEFIVQQSDLSKEKIQESKLYRTLYGNDSNDTQVTYTSFDNYYFDKEETINVEVFKHLKAVLDNFCNFLNSDPGELDELIQPAWEESSEFNFIPKYDKDEDCLLIKGITQQQRVVFFAICKYFEQEYYDEKNFKRWMRVVWNLTGNINDEDSMISNLRLIDELARNSNDIYNYLKKSPPLKSNANKEQVDEEVEKAKQILYGKRRSDSNTWEDIIIKAEQSAFFKGAIRFLFHNSKGQTDWEDFDAKLGNAQEYFDNNGVQNTSKCNYKSEAKLLKFLVSRCDDIEKIFEIIKDKKTFFNNSDKTWRKVLLSVDWTEQVHKMLMKGTTVDKSYSKKNGGEWHVYTKKRSINVSGCEKSHFKGKKFMVGQWCADNGLFNYIQENLPNAKLIVDDNNRYFSFYENYKKQHKIPLIPSLRELHESKRIKYRDDCCISDSHYPKCNGIRTDYGVDFSYTMCGTNKSHKFRWVMDSKDRTEGVYVLNDDWELVENVKNNRKTKNGCKVYYFFGVTDKIVEDRFRMENALEKLIKSYDPAAYDLYKKHMNYCVNFLKNKNKK